MTILIVCFYENLFIAKLVEGTVGHLRVKDALKIFRESCQSLVAELTSAAEVFHAIPAVETHIKPLNLQCSIGGWDFSLWEHVQDTQHLFKPMEMVHRRDEEILADSKIAAWTHVNPLAVTRLFLVQGMLEKNVHHVLKAVSHGATVRRQSCFRIGWFWEVIHKNLLPVAQ